MSSTTLHAAPRVVSAYDVRRLATIMTDAFFDDPVFAWFFQRERGRHARIERFFRDIALKSHVFTEEAQFPGRFEEKVAAGDQRSSKVRTSISIPAVPYLDRKVRS